MSKTRLENREEELEFEEGKIYKTKFQTGEFFDLKKIKRHPISGRILGFEGIYVSHPDVGICPLAYDRLYPERKYNIVEVKICECCGKDL